MQQRVESKSRLAQYHSVKDSLKEPNQTKELKHSKPTHLKSTKKITTSKHTTPAHSKHKHLPKNN